MVKLPTRSPTHQDIEMQRLAALGLEVEDLAENGVVELDKLIELAEERGRPTSHYLAATAFTSDVKVGPARAPLVVRVCAGTCQRYGALDLLDHLAGKHRPRFAIAPVSCLDRCDQAPACEIHGEHGQLVLAPATVGALDEALSAL